MRIVVPGRVGGKGRPRATARGGFVRMYTPAKTTVSEAIVKHFAAQAMNGKPLLDGPLWLKISVWLQPPESWSKKRKAAARFVTGKPDLDNVLKLIGDALNGIIWRDDAQLSDVQINREYTTDPESVVIEVGTLGTMMFERSAA